VKRWISARLAGTILLIAMGAMAIFHLLAIAGVVPPDMVWGGRAGESVVALEIVSLGITLLFAWIIAAKAGFVRTARFAKVVGIAAWVVCAYFALNIGGNLVSTSGTERLIFAPVAAVLALLAWRLAAEK
jgi:hypothetical protein